MPNEDKLKLTEEQIGLIQEAYDDFRRGIAEIEKERDARIMEIIKGIDEKMLEEARKNLN